MVNENFKLMAENKKPVETVYEIKDEYKVPSFEEFMKTYESNEEVEILTEVEYQDRVLHGSQFGPGNEQSKEVAKKIGSIALATTYFTPLGAVTAPMTAVAASTGGAMWIVGKGSGNDELREAGGFIFGTAFDATVDGLSAGTLRASAPAIAKLTREVCEVISELGNINDKIEALNRRGIYIPMELSPQERVNFVNHILKYGI